MIPVSVRATALNTVARTQTGMGVALLEGQRGSGGTPVTGVTLVASEEARLWLKVAFGRVDRAKATFSHL